MGHISLNFAPDKQVFKDNIFDMDCVFNFRSKMSIVVDTFFVYIFVVIHLD